MKSRVRLADIEELQRDSIMIEPACANISTEVAGERVAEPPALKRRVLQLEAGPVEGIDCSPIRASFSVLRRSPGDRRACLLPREPLLCADRREVVQFRQRHSGRTIESEDAPGERVSEAVAGRSGSVEEVTLIEHR